MTLALGVHGKAPGGNAVTQRVTPAVTTQAAGSSFFVAVSDPNQNIKVEDNKGNAKYRRVLYNPGSTSKISIWACFNGNGGAGHQATVDWLSGTADPTVTFHEITAATSYAAVLELLATAFDNTAPQGLTSPTLGGSGRLGMVMASSETIVTDYNESTGYSLSEEETNDALYWTHSVRAKAGVGPTAESPNFPTIGSGVPTLFGFLSLTETQASLQLGDSGKDFQLDGAGTSPSTITLNTSASGSILLAFAAGEFAKMDPPTYNGGSAMPLLESSGYGVPPGSLWAGFGFEIYGDAISGGTGHVLSMVKPVSPAQESTLIGVEIRGGGSIIDTSITTRAAPGANTPITSDSVTTTGPAILVALWSGDGGVGTTDQTATPGDGWTLVEYEFLGSTAYIQAAVAIKFVEAGTHTATWTAVANQGAILGLVAVQSGATDTTAPVLSSPTGSVTTPTTATVGATTDEGNGTMYAVVTTSATQPSVAQIKAGQDHTSAAAAWAGSQAVASAGAKTLNATGLAQNTTFYAHLVHTDAAANDSNRVSSASFTTGQRGVPTSTVSAGSWSPTNAATLHEAIDETPASDADYISTNVAADVCTVAISSLTDPASSTGHVVRYRLRGDGASGITVALMQGASVVASWTHDPAPSSFTTFVQTLSGAEADSITDYGALRLRFTEI